MEEVEEISTRITIIDHGKIDAAVIDRGDGEFEIQTIRSDNFKSQ